jgi:hypothetical protein
METPSNLIAVAVCLGLVTPLFILGGWFNDLKRQPQARPTFSGSISNATLSMLPCIDERTSAEYTTDFVLTPGRIYVYAKGEGLIIHRLQYIADGYCYFKGDNNRYMDERVNCTAVQWEVTALRYG